MERNGLVCPVCICLPLTALWEFLVSTTLWEVREKKGRRTEEEKEERSLTQ